MLLLMLLFCRIFRTQQPDYGGGEWPHLTSYNRGELLGNGNYLEPEGVSRRHGICGDPEQVRADGLVEAVPTTEFHVKFPHKHLLHWY